MEIKSDTESESESYASTIQPRQKKKKKKKKKKKNDFIVNAETASSISNKEVMFFPRDPFSFLINMMRMLWSENKSIKLRNRRQS